MPLSWGVLHGREVPEPDFVQAISQLPVGRVLPGLITLLQYGDASGPPAYAELDRRVCDIFPTETARRIADWLSREPELIFFSKWQLLFAIKLLCTFGSRDASQAQVSDYKFLDFLLMTNGFYPRGESDLGTVEGVTDAIRRPPC